MILLCVFSSDLDLYILKMTVTLTQSYQGQLSQL